MGYFLKAADFSVADILLVKITLPLCKDQQIRVSFFLLRENKVTLKCSSSLAVQSLESLINEGPWVARSQREREV